MQLNFVLYAWTQDELIYGPKTWLSSCPSVCGVVVIKSAKHAEGPVFDPVQTQVPCGLTARISGFHPEGPGSTPGMGIILVYFINNL